MAISRCKGVFTWRYIDLPVDDLPVHHDLVAWACDQDIAQDHLARVDDALASLAHDSGRGACQQRDVVQMALGTPLLHYPHDDVHRH
jgi:hypothetical protein